MAGPDESPDRLVAPRAVVLSVRLMLARAGVAVVSILVNLLDQGALRRAIRDAHPDYDPVKVDNTLDYAVASAVIISVVVLVLYLLLARQVARGRDWARLTTIGLAAIFALFGLISLLGNRPLISLVIGVILLVLDVAIVVLLTTKPARRFTAATRRAGQVR